MYFYLYSMFTAALVGLNSDKGRPPRINQKNAIYEVYAYIQCVKDLPVIKGMSCYA